MKFKSSFFKFIVTLLIIAVTAVAIYFLADNILVLAVKIIGLFLPFIAAYIVSTAVNPLVGKLEKHLKMPRKVSAIIVILLTVGILGGVLFAVGWKITDEIQSLYRQIPQITEAIKEKWKPVSESFMKMYDNLPVGVRDAGLSWGNDIAKYMAEILKNNSGTMLQGIGNFAKALPKLFVWVIVFILSLFFMVSDSKTMRRVVGRCFTKRFRVKFRKIKKEIKRYLGGYIKAQLIIMSITAIIILIGLSILGVQYALLIAIGIALLDALPFFGSGAALWPWSIISFINGDIKSGIGLIIIYLAVVFTRQMIEPKIVSESIGIYPVFTLMSMYLGFKIFSLGGMILGPIVLILGVSLYKAGVLDGIIKFFKHLFGILWSELKDISHYLVQ